MYNFKLPIAWLKYDTWFGEVIQCRDSGKDPTNTMNQENQNQYSGLDLVRIAGSSQTHQPMAMNNYQRTREMTLDELMLENRVIFLIGEINQASSARAMMQMLYLEDQKRGQQINLYINSPGGAVDDTLAMYDTMQFITSEVATYCVGRAYSGAAVLLCAGESGKRHILPHAKVMIHQPYGGITGQTTDIQIQAEQIIGAKKTLNEIISSHSGQPFDTVAADGERDKYFSAEEAVAYGLVDEVFALQDDKKKD